MEGILRAGLAVSLFIWLLFAVLSRDNGFLHWWVGIPLLAYVAGLAIRRRLPGPSAVDWPAAGLIVVAAVSVVISIDPRVSAEVALSRAVAVVVFYAVLETAGLRAGLVFRTFVAVGLLVSGFAMMNVTLQYLEWLDMVRAVTGGLSTSDLVPPTLPRDSVAMHPNLLAKFLNLILPLALAMAVRPQARTDRYLAIACLAFGSVALFFTGSRGGWLAAAAWLTVMALLLPGAANIGERLTTVRAQLKTNGRWLVASAAAMLAGAAAVVALTLATHPDWLFRATVGDRVEASGVAIDIAKDHWLLGAGPATYVAHFETYKGSLTNFYPNAHNLYAGTLAEVGLLGTLVLVAGGVILSRALLDALRRSRHNRHYVAAVIAMLVAALVHGLADFSLAWNAVLLPLAVLLGVVLRDESAGTPQRARTPRRIPAMLPALLVVALVPLTVGLWAYSDRARGEYDASLIAAAGGLDGVPAAVQAAESDPAHWAYQMHAGVSLAQRYLASLETGLVDQPALDDAIAFLRRAESLAPENSLVNANLASALRLAGDRDGATEAARRAIANSPVNPAAFAVAGDVFGWTGLHDEMADAYGSALALDPTLAQSPFWIDRSPALRDDVVARSGIAACDLARYAGLYGVFTEDLGLLIDRCQAEFAAEGTSVQRASLAVALAASGRLDAARTLVQDASSAAQRSPDMRLASAVVSAGTDLTAARRELLTAQRLGSKDARALLLASYALPESPRTRYDIRTPLSGSGEALPAALAPLANNLADSTTSAALLAQAGWTRDLYNYESLRGSPQTILIPGEWTGLLSPRGMIGLLALPVANP